MRSMISVNRSRNTSTAKPRLSINAGVRRSLKIHRCYHGGANAPVTGKQALFVNEGFTTRIVDVSEKESEALLGFLFAHITKPEFQVRWRWQPNDIAIWDNRVTQHYANADYLPQRRIMHRATILGIFRFIRRGKGEMPGWITRHNDH